MSRCSFAVWRPLPENSTQKRIDPDQAILHSAVDAPGPTSLYPYFSRADVTLESHFFIKLDGTVEQYIDTNVQADANRLANPRAISIETEDEGNPDQRPWTEAQVASILRLLEWICATHPKVQRRQCPAWDEPGIGWHAMWGAPSPWTPAKGKTCPGVARVGQAEQIIGQVAGATATTEWDEMATKDEIKDGLREVLNEGTAFGYLGWADTNKGIVEALRVVANRVLAEDDHLDATEVAALIQASFPKAEAAAIATAVLAALKETL